MSLPAPKLLECSSARAEPCSQHVSEHDIARAFRARARRLRRARQGARAGAARGAERPPAVGGGAGGGGGRAAPRPRPAAGLGVARLAGGQRHPARQRLLAQEEEHEGAAGEDAVASNLFRALLLRIGAHRNGVCCSEVWRTEPRPPAHRQEVGQHQLNHYLINLDTFLSFRSSIATGIN